MYSIERRLRSFSSCSWKGKKWIIYYILYLYRHTHIYISIYAFIYFAFKGFHSKTRRPFEKRVVNLIKYISIEKVLVLNKNKVLKYWKTCLNVCTESNSFLSQILFCFGPGPAITSAFLLQEV